MNIELPLPPSTNPYYRKVNGRMLISKRGREYKDAVYACVLEQLGIFKPFTGPLSIVVDLFPPEKRKRDLDNFAGKALYDALAYSNVFMDDSQIRESHNYFREVVKGGKCEVLLEEL